MQWYYITGQNFVRIEACEGGECFAFIVEIPLACQGAEKIAEAICDAHNESMGNPE